MAAAQAVNPPSQQSFLFYLENAGLLRKGQKARGSQTEQRPGCGVSRDLREGDVMLKKPSKPWRMMAASGGNFSQQLLALAPTLSLH